MESVRENVFAALESMQVAYEIIEHPAVYTIEEMDRLEIDSKNEVVKNLFLRDDKKKRWFLVVLQKDKRVDLKEIRTKLNCRPLSFASEEDLGKYMKLGKGAVTPFGVLNDAERRVEVVFDKDILHFERIGVHPNDNTATVWLCPQDLETIIKKQGNDIFHIEL